MSDDQTQDQDWMAWFKASFAEHRAIWVAAIVFVVATILFAGVARFIVIALLAAMGWFAASGQLQNVVESLTSKGEQDQSADADDESSR